MSGPGVKLLAAVVALAAGETSSGAVCVTTKPPRERITFTEMRSGGKLAA